MTGVARSNLTTGDRSTEQVARHTPGPYATNVARLSDGSMNISVFHDFMRAVDRDIERRRQPDRLDPFREFGRELDKDREIRAAGNGNTEYFKRPTWNFLKGAKR
jgi:hypothetical protein